MKHSIKSSVTRSQLASLFLKDLKGGGLFIETSGYVGLDDKVTLELLVEELGTPMIIKGKVAWHRRPRAWSSSLPSGIGFEFDESEVGVRDFLQGYGKGTIEDRRGGGPRTLSEMAVKIKVGDTWISATTSNVSPGGMAFMLDRELNEGSNLQCIVYRDDSPKPVDCNVVIDRVEKRGDMFLVGAKFQRTTPLVRRSFSIVPPPPDGPTGRVSSRPPSRFGFTGQNQRSRTPTITPAPHPMPRTPKHTIPYKD